METFIICMSGNRTTSKKVLEFPIQVPSTATVNEILYNTLELTNLHNNEDQTHALFLERESKKPLALATTVQSLQTRKLFLNQILFDITVYIMHLEQELHFGLCPLMTVTEAVQFMEQSNFKSGKFHILTDHLQSITPSHELFLVTTSDQSSTTAKGIPLDFNRTLRSYRISPFDTLVLTVAQNHNRAWTEISGTDDEIPVIVSSTFFSCSKAFKMSTTGTFQSVLTTFLERTNKVVLHQFFTLALDIGGIQGETMTLEDALNSYPLPTPARLVCIAKKRPKQVVFGVDPNTLPLVNDMGVDVPEILVLLRDMLMLLNPLEQEGIFRKAGNETEMKQMIKDFNKGLPVQCTNIHSVATLLKRWFKDLPKRIFSHLDKSILDDEERLYNIYDELSPLESSLAKWLIELLVDVSKNSDVNKMIPQNLGIVFGPGVFGSNSSMEGSSKLSAIAMLTSDSKTGQEIIEKIVEYLLANPQKRPLKPEKPAMNTIIENSYHAASPGAVMLPFANITKGRPQIILDFSGDSKMAQMLARRRQLVEGELQTNQPEMSPSSPPAPVKIPSPAVTPIATSPSISSSGPTTPSPAPMPMGDIHSELANRLAGGVAGLRKSQAISKQSPPKTDFRKSIALLQTSKSNPAVMRRFSANLPNTDEDTQEKDKETTNTAPISPPIPPQSSPERPPVESNNSTRRSPAPPPRPKRLSTGQVPHQTVNTKLKTEVPAQDFLPPSYPAPVPLSPAAESGPLRRTMPSRLPSDLLNDDSDPTADSYSQPLPKPPASLSVLPIPTATISKLDLLIQEGQAYMEEEATTHSTPTPPRIPKLSASDRKLESLMNDDDSDPIRELEDFVDEESTPLEKLLGLESPSRTLSPPEPTSKSPPQRVPWTPPRPTRSTSNTAPSVTKSQDAITPIERATTTPPLRSNIQTPTQVGKSEYTPPKKSNAEKRKSLKRFGRLGGNSKKDNRLKTSATDISDALQQPGITWGKSKDAEALLQKLRGEGLDL